MAGAQCRSKGGKARRKVKRRTITMPLSTGSLPSRGAFEGASAPHAFARTDCSHGRAGGCGARVTAMVVVFMLAAGFFVDATVLIVMLTSIFLPLLRQLGADPVHCGRVFIIAATIGDLTPLVGAAMHAACSILRVPAGNDTRESPPVFLAISAATFGLILMPGVVLFLPNLMFGRC